MLIRTGLGGQLSGSVGGVTASHNRYGQYLRNRTVPVNPNTDRQQAVREAFATATTSWRDLTNAQREAWTAYANQTPVLNRLGESVTLTGQAMYVRTNAWLLAAGYALLPDAPPSPGLATLTIDRDQINVDASTATISVAGTTGTVTEAALQIGPPLSAGKTFFKGPYTFVASSTNTGGGYSFAVPADIRYGVLVTGQRRPIRMAGQDADGRLSSSIDIVVEVVP